jgi:hypothetical protein
MKKFFKFWIMALVVISLGYTIGTIMFLIIKFIYFLPPLAFYIVIVLLSINAIATLMFMLNDYLEAKYPNKEN